MLNHFVAVALAGSIAFAAPALAQSGSAQSGSAQSGSPQSGPAPAGLAQTDAASQPSPSDSNAIPPEFITGHNAMTARSLHGQTVMVPESPPDKNLVTIYGRHRCRKRDQACVDRVSAEIWTKYPQQIRALCTATAIHNIREGMVEAELGIGGVRNDRFTPATQALCQYGDKLKKAQLAARAAATPPVDPDPDALPQP
jgi:hypothetical protein